MKTAQEREAAFRFELAELLARHNAELEITLGGGDYGTCGIAEVTMISQYDENHKKIAEYTEFTI
jgi:hypothetical protein